MKGRSCSQENKISKGTLPGVETNGEREEEYIN